MTTQEGGRLINKRQQAALDFLFFMNDMNDGAEGGMHDALPRC